MAIIREYRTEEECARCWIKEDFSKIPSLLVTEQEGFFDRYEFFSENEEGEYTYVGEPMWGTYFSPDDQVDCQWFQDNAEAVAKLGFTLIYEDGEFFALGIDGAGFDFYEAYWIPLYRTRGLKWHDEPEGDAE